MVMTTMMMVMMMMMMIVRMMSMATNEPGEMFLSMRDVMAEFVFEI